MKINMGIWHKIEPSAEFYRRYNGLAAKTKFLHTHIRKVFNVHNDDGNIICPVFILQPQFIWFSGDGRTCIPGICILCRLNRNEINLSAEYRGYSNLEIPEMKITSKQIMHHVGQIEKPAVG